MKLAEKYKLLKAVGRGAYGTVFLAKRIADGRALVCKRVNMKNMTEKEQTDARLEVEFLQKFDNVNITKYYECIVEDGSLNIFMEFAEKGELYTLIQKRKSQYKLFTEDEIMNFFVQIALAVSHMHEKNILHRDLKSKNIFVNKQGLLKVGDFGIAKVLNSSSDVAKTAIGTPYYLSPEICEDKPYNHKSDVWALGCVLYELTTLNHAFDGQSLPALVLKILSGKYPAISSRYSAQLKRLIDSMFRRNPKARPSVRQMLRQPYVKAYADKYLARVSGSRVEEGETGEKGVVAMEPQAKATPAAAKGDWFREQEAALRELNQALNVQKEASPCKGPSPASQARRPHPAPEREKKPLPVFRKAPASRRAAPTAAPSRQGPPRDPVKEKWSKKRWLREQKEKDEMFRLKAEAEAKKAAKSEALHAEIRANKEAKLKREAEVRKQMQRHKSEMKKVKPRLSKDMLKAAGEAFAQRHRGQLLNPNASESSAACQVLEKVPPRREAAVRGSEGMSRVEEQRGGFPAVEIFVPQGSGRGPTQQRQRRPLSRQEREMHQAVREVECLPDPAGAEDDREEEQVAALSASISSPSAAGSLGGSCGETFVVHDCEEVGEGNFVVPGPEEPSRGKGNSGKDLALRVGIGQRIESLRVTLEDKIGEEKFISVYKYLRKIGGDQGDADAETQARLEGILGTQNIQYAFLIHKLLMLEDSLY